jgi:hypothetical protein
MQSVKTDNNIGREIDVAFIMVLKSRIIVHALNG